MAVKLTIRFVWYAVHVYFDQPTTIITVIVERKRNVTREFSMNVENETKKLLTIKRRGEEEEEEEEEGKRYTVVSQYNHNTV